MAHYNLSNYELQSVVDVFKVIPFNMTTTDEISYCTASDECQHRFQELNTEPESFPGNEFPKMDSDGNVEEFLEMVELQTRMIPRRIIAHSVKERLLSKAPGENTFCIKERKESTFLFPKTIVKSEGVNCGNTFTDVNNHRGMLEKSNNNVHQSSNGDRTFASPCYIDSSCSEWPKHSCLRTNISEAYNLGGRATILKKEHPKEAIPWSSFFLKILPLILLVLPLVTAEGE